MLSKIKTFLKNNIIEYALYFKYKYIFKMDIDRTVKVSMKSQLDTTNPKGVHIGAYTMVTANVSILTHDFVHQVHKDTYIGKNCFIGMNTIILAGVIVGDNVIVGAGSVITKNMPNNSIVAGNPARVIKTNIQVSKYGILMIPENI